MPFLQIAQFSTWTFHPQRATAFHSLMTIRLSISIIQNNNYNNSKLANHSIDTVTGWHIGAKHRRRSNGNWNTRQCGIDSCWSQRNCRHNNWLVNKGWGQLCWRSSQHSWGSEASFSIVWWETLRRCLLYGCLTCSWRRSENSGHGKRDIRSIWPIRLLIKHGHLKNWVARGCQTVGNHRPRKIYGNHWNSS